MTGLHHNVIGSGPAVALLHPIGLSGEFWPGLASRLAGSHSVVTIDLLGHGLSPDAPRPGRMSDQVSAVTALLDSLSAGPAVLVGVSFGGMIAQHVALARPDLVRGLVVAGSMGRAPESAREMLVQRGAEAEAGGMAAIVDPTLERWFTPEFMSDDAVARVRERLLANAPANWAAAWEAIAGHDALERLGSLTVPARVIAGELDRAITIDTKRALSEAFSDASFVVLEGSPHMMQIETAGRFADAIVDFLQDT